MGKLSKSKIIIGGSMLITIMVLALALLWFRSNINSMVSETTEKYLTENAEALAAIFNAKLDDQLVMLESQTRYFEDVDMTRYNDMKNTIMSTKGVGAFKTIGVASSSGSTLNYNGQSSGNILLTDYFREAMDGSSSISATTSVDEEGDNVLTVAVPIMNGLSPKGVIFGTFDDEILSTLVETTTFDNSGENLLLSEDGTILARTSDSILVPADVVNFYEAIGKKNAPEKGRTKTVAYDNGYEKLMAVLSPIGVHDWYFATVIPQSIISEQSHKISSYMVTVTLAVVLAFLILVFALVQVLRDNDLIIRKNERFEMASVQHLDIIIDYNYIKSELSLAGYVDNIIGTPKRVFSSNEVTALFDLIHPDDKKFINDIYAIKETNVQSLSGEIRIKCLDGKYNWFRVRATVLRAENGKVIQLIGSIVNVDDQMHKERHLIEKAETDLVTGILNKEAFSAKIENDLGRASEDEMFALYIIDLDNFKKVNDTLGHEMGNQVLADVAKKLCTIFSERDCVGRIGGDEFAAFLRLTGDGKKIGTSIIRGKGNAIISALRETYSLYESSVEVSSSVGIAIYPTAGKNYDDLYKNADLALYEVKSSGKNQFKIFDEARL